MNIVLEYSTIIIGLVLGLWVISALLVPCIIRWYDGRHVVSTIALLSAAGQPVAGDDVKIVYSTNDRASGGGGGCVVCLEEYKDGERCATIVACNHKFHSLCVLPWVIWHHTCPICRITV